MPKLFFALPLPELAPELATWRDQRPWPGQPVPESNLHLTLAFLGEADETTQARLIAVAERQHCPLSASIWIRPAGFSAPKPPGWGPVSGRTS